MFDQADSLRRLVMAQRQWRELTLRNQPAAVSRPRLSEASLSARGDDEDRSLVRSTGIGVFMARAARWAFTRAGVRAD
jgi:hypothetical protein